MMMESGMQARLSTNGTFCKGDKSSIEIGYGSYGCSHYRRMCKIRAPCCNEIFDCRHCHNEAKNSLDVDPLLRHDIPRHDMNKVICSLCGTEQDVRQHCIQCGVCMGKYFCAKCKFFDDDVSKKHYHCNECGICRVGGEDNFFHCNKCGCCYSKLMENSHNCVEKAMHHNCPVCFEFLFRYNERHFRSPVWTHYTFRMCEGNGATFTIYMSCLLKILLRHVGVWEKLDHEVASTPMPQIYQHKMVWILCNDCSEISEVNYHIVAHKCLKCKSYNTRLTQGGPSSCSPRIAQMVR